MTEQKHKGQDRRVLLTVSECSEITGAKGKAIYAALAAKRLIGTKYGSSWMVHRRDLDKWNENRGRWPKKE